MVGCIAVVQEFNLPFEFRLFIVADKIVTNSLARDFTLGTPCSPGVGSKLPL